MANRTVSAGKAIAIGVLAATPSLAHAEQLTSPARGLDWIMQLSSEIERTLEAPATVARKEAAPVVRPVSVRCLRAGNGKMMQEIACGSDEAKAAASRGKLVVSTE
jgi:hypothetical protein